MRLALKEWLVVSMVASGLWCSPAHATEPPPADGDTGVPTADSTPVAASPDGATPDAVAPDGVALFDEGAGAFREGRFEEAIAKFEQSYAISPEPILLYNIARAHEGLDQPEQALSFYRRYLEALPNATDRGAVEKRLLVLEKAVERKQAANQPKPTPLPPPTAPAPGPSPWPWMLAGAGAAGMVAGGVLGVLFADKQDEANAEPVANAAADVAADADSLGTGSAVAWIAGGSLVALGLTWGIIDMASLSGSEPSSPESASTAYTLHVGLGPSHLLIEGTFW